MLNRFVLTIALFSLPLVGDALAQGEPWTTVEEIELRPTNPAHYLEFGVDLRLRGSTLLVGSRASFTGSTHVFDGSSGTWLETATLRPASEPSSGACDISGETIVAGAYANGAGGGQSGAVYVFERVGGVWTETDFLLAPAPLANDRFGDSVALQGDTLVVGAPRSLANEPGHAFVFERVGGAWGVVAELSAPNAVEGDEFGTQVAIDGDVIAVGAWEDSSSRGACHVFRRNGGQWGLEETLRGSDTVHSDLFGWSVALEGDTIAVSALRGSGTRGAVFVFRHGPAGWSEEAKLTQYDNHVGDHLGSSVALSGDLLLAGTINDTEGRVGSGAGHLFERSGATWTHIGRFVPSDPSAHSWFGEQVALGTGVAVVSAFRDTSPTSVGGGVYVFHSPEGGVSNVCSATVGSSGAAARLTFNGSTSLAASDVTLHAIGAPAGTSALFFRGTEPAGVPLGAGVLCISPFTPGLARLVPAVPSDVHGTSIRVLAPADLPPGLLPGDSIYFQCMFRDMASPGPTIQLTDSLRVTFSG